VVLVLLAATLGLLGGFASRGRLQRLAEARLRWWPIALFAVAAVATSELSRARLAGLGLQLAGLAAAGAFALRNLAVPGMILSGAGALANLAVGAVDRGMPVAGAVTGAHQVLHHALGPGDHLAFLADRFELVGLRVSPGDLLLAAGVAVSTWALMVRPSPEGNTK